MMQSLLVPLDGSALADRAVPFAAALAARTGWSVLLLRAIDTLSAPTDSDALALRKEAQEALDVVAAALAADGVGAETRVVDGPPESAILEAAADESVSLIVMSTHGRGGLGRFIYGSVADAVLRQSPVPVLTVPPHGLESWPKDRTVKVMVPLDGSELCRVALGPACEVADILGGSLLLASVAPLAHHAAYAEGYTFIEPDPDDIVLVETRRYLEEVAQELRTETRSVEVCVAYGSPYFKIMTIARDRGVGLIVMATHGRGGVSRALLGSVATATVGQTDVPIVLVRPDHAGRVAEVSEVAAPEPAEAPAAERAEADEPAITLALSADELTTIMRAVADRFYGEAVDPRWAEPTRLLLEKLRRAQVVTAGAADQHGEPG